jgi:hypothetical protein
VSFRDQEKQRAAVRQSLRKRRERLRAEKRCVDCGFGELTTLRLCALCADERCRRNKTKKDTR